MAVNTTDVRCPPGAAFAVLADPWSYADWVVGSAETREVTGTWPEPGSTFHHTQGVPKVGLKDTTSVLEADAPRRLKLEVRIRPLLTAHVTFELAPDGDGTQVTMTEVPVAGLLDHVPRTVLDAAIKLRNAETLRRLKRRCEND